MPINRESTVVMSGERLDNLANRLYGNPLAYQALILVNPTLDIWQPQPGKQIEVPRVR